MCQHRTQQVPEEQMQFDFGEALTQCANDYCRKTFLQRDRYRMVGDDYCSRKCALSDNINQVFESWP